MAWIKRILGAGWQQFFLRLVLAVTVGLLVYPWLASWLSPDEDSEFFGDNILTLVLVNLNIVLLCILAFMIGRNVLKLVFDRRQRILGSALRMRLVFAFVVLTLVPTIIIFFMASGLLNRAMEGWFSTQIEGAVSSAVDIGRFYFGQVKSDLGDQTLKLAAGLEKRYDRAYRDTDLIDYLERYRQEKALHGIRVITRERNVVAEALNAATAIEKFKAPEPDQAAINKALFMQPGVISMEKEGGQFVQAYWPVRLADQPLVLVVTLRVDPELVQSLSNVNDSFQEYQQLKLVNSEIRSGYLLILAMVTGSLLFAAIWTGFYIARILVVPIQRLAEGTRAVASGDYSLQIESNSDDEMGFLVKSFNRMTSDLRTSRQVAEDRKIFLETVLGNLAVGVIALDREDHITSINQAAARIYGVTDADQAIGQSINSIFQAEDRTSIEDLLTKAGQEKPDPEESTIIEKEITVLSEGRELKIVCTAGRIIDSKGDRLGTVLLFDDVTELAKAQSMAVWREVARRIAHEIKNPLTPIQLSAQRLQKLLAGRGFDQEVGESVQAIVENVDSIKRLANEFSNFARMPTAEFQLANLNVLISDCIGPYAESHSDIVFQFISDSKMPDVRMDREQIRRVLINLIENATDALTKAPPGTSDGNTPKIIIKSFYDRREKMVSFEVIDNGPGILLADRARVFEPYYTTKKRGTGLGLAIVTSIIADHQGKIRVYDNSPRGAKFIVELPLVPRDMTQRRLVNA